jgi:hypothetical protein
MEVTINYVLCMFFRKYRVRRWQGWCGIGYTEKPLMAKENHLFQDYFEKMGTRFNTERRRADKGDSDLLVKTPTGYKIIKEELQREIEPTDERIEKGIIVIR